MSDIEAGLTELEQVYQRLKSISSGEAVTGHDESNENLQEDSVDAIAGEQIQQIIEAFKVSPEAQKKVQTFLQEFESDITTINPKAAMAILATGIVFGALIEKQRNNNG